MPTGKASVLTAIVKSSVIVIDIIGKLILFSIQRESALNDKYNVIVIKW